MRLIQIRSNINVRRPDKLGELVQLDETPVLGLASCELFGQPGALDLLLPRLHTGEALPR